MMSEQKIGIIGAMEPEIELLRARMQSQNEETVSGIRFFTGKLCGKRVVLARCGIGKVFAAIAAQTMILRFGVTHLLNTGVAGGLAPGLTIGDAVVADAVVQHDMNTMAVGDPRGLISGLDLIRIQTDKALRDALSAATARLQIHTVIGTVASGDLFVEKEKTKKNIASEFGAVACEMEGAAIGLAAHVNHIPFAVLRTISDGGDGMDYQQFLPFAADRSQAVTTAFLELI